MNFKVGDWAVYERRIVQIKRLDKDGIAEVSDGSFASSGMLLNQLRPLTLRNKRIGEWFEHYYEYIRQIDGSAGFNFPDINRYFAQLALQAIDANDEGSKAFFDLASQFVRDAKEYKTPIQGVNLFWRAA